MRYFLAFFGLLASSASSPAAFIDATAASRIGFNFAPGKTPDPYLIEAMGGGVAMLDADGRLDRFFVNRTVDIVVATNDGPPRIFRNGAAGSSWLTVDTVGVKSNRDGIGAALRIVGASGQQQFGFVSTAGSYLSAHGKRVHFGLGRDHAIAVLEVRWPSGLVQTWKNVPGNQVFVAREGKP